MNKTRKTFRLYIIDGLPNISNNKTFKNLFL